MIILIGGIFFYIYKVRAQLKRDLPPLDDNPDAIIGGDPEPVLKSKYS
jgi:hypothetical protein